jgi:hypothetical protein
LDKAKSNTENIWGLNFVAVILMTVQVLQPEVLLIGHNLLYRDWIKRGLVYVLYIYEL